MSRQSTCFPGARFQQLKGWGWEHLLPARGVKPDWESDVKDHWPAGQPDLHGHGGHGIGWKLPQPWQVSWQGAHFGWNIVYLAETFNLKINFFRPTLKIQSAPKSLSYSSMAKKEPLQPIKPNIIKPQIPPLAIHRAEPKKPTAPCMRVAETALMAGYRCFFETRLLAGYRCIFDRLSPILRNCMHGIFRFRASNPEHDPRYPADQQMMVKPELKQKCGMRWYSLNRWDLYQGILTMTRFITVWGAFFKRGGLSVLCFYIK